MMIKVTKKINIAVFAVIFLIGMNGCGNDKTENKEMDSSDAITSTKEPKSNIIDKKELPEESYGTIKDGVYTATGGALQMSVPETWQVSEKNTTILVAGNEEDTKDCVTIHVAEKDDGFKKYKQEDFEEAYNKLFDNLEFEEFEQTQIGNLDAIYMKYSCSKDSTDLTEHQYMLNGDSTYLISFTDVSGELEKEIENCMDSVVICK